MKHKKLQEEGERIDKDAEKSTDPLKKAEGEEEIDAAARDALDGF